jgi:N-acetylglutamate synthase-like GNAT family acetyltransferase
MLASGVAISHRQPTTLAITVRRAHDGDATALAALINRAYAIEAEFVSGERTSPDEVRQMIAAAGQFLVLEDASVIVAAVYLEPRPERATGYIGLLSVDPRLQGRGVGKRLVRIAEAMLEALGARTVELRVVNLREELSRWYKGLGYAEVGTAPFDHTGKKRPCHFVEMRRALV